MGVLHQQESRVFQEHHCATLTTFWVATWSISLSLCFREHSFQSTSVAWRLPFTVFHLSSALQTEQSWRRLNLKADVLVLCNMTFSSIHTSFGQLHHRLNTLRFKANIPILFKTPFGSTRLKGRLDRGGDYSLRREITKPQRRKKIQPKTGQIYCGGKIVLRL